MHHTREKAAPLSPSQLLAHLPVDVLCLDYLCACKMQVNIAKWSNFYLCQADRHCCALCWEIMELCFPSSLCRPSTGVLFTGMSYSRFSFQKCFTVTEMVCGMNCRTTELSEI